MVSIEEEKLSILIGREVNLPIVVVRPDTLNPIYQTPYQPIIRLSTNYKVVEGLSTSKFEHYRNSSRHLTTLIKLEASIMEYSKEYNNLSEKERLKASIYNIFERIGYNLNEILQRDEKVNAIALRASNSREDKRNRKERLNHYVSELGHQWSLSIKRKDLEDLEEELGGIDTLESYLYNALESMESTYVLPDGELVINLINNGSFATPGKLDERLQLINCDYNMNCMGILVYQDKFSDKISFKSIGHIKDMALEKRDSIVSQFNRYNFNFSQDDIRVYAIASFDIAFLYIGHHHGAVTERDKIIKVKEITID